MSKSAKELAKQGIVAGKPLAEWADAPAGAFAKAVRETGVDPQFGLREPGDPENEKQWTVKVNYSYQPEREYSSKTYTVTASSEEEAEEIAEELFESDDSLDGDDAEIDDLETEEE